MAKNKLFNLASRAARFQARRTLQRSPMGRALTEARRALRTGVTTQLRRQVRKAQREITGRAAMNRVQREIQRYSISGMAMQAVNAMLGSMGPVGQVIKSALARRRRPADQLQMAADLLRTYGYEILGKDPRWSGYSRGEEAAKELLTNAGYTITPAGKVVPVNRPFWMEEPGEESDQAEQPENLTSRPSASAPSREREEAREQEDEGEQQVSMTPEIRTPASSNVYSFQYDYQSKTLYVRFQEHSVNPASMSKAGGRTHVRGHLGHTVGGKTGAPGARYAYFDVPVRIFEKLVRAPSAGRAVWDELRVRGTAYGHRFQYSLSEAQTVTHQGVTGVYIPRKITAQGYRARTMPVEGTGRRIWAHSALPEERRVWRGRPQAPNRGTPDRGR